MNILFIIKWLFTILLGIFIHTILVISLHSISVKYNNYVINYNIRRMMQGQIWVIYPHLKMSSIP